MPETLISFEYSIGDRVCFVGLDDKIVGHIVSLWVADRGIRYEVAYFMDGSHKEEYFYSFQIKPAPEKREIGFNTEKDN